MKTHALLCLLAPALGGALLAAAPAKVLRVIEVGPRPESVTRGFGGAYYVTVMGGTRPGDGAVKVLRGGHAEVFASGLDEPKGIAFTGDLLVTTDVKRVWKIDAQGHKTVLAAEADFPHPIRFLNDTAAAPDGQSVFVSDMGAQKQLAGPNGLWPLNSPEARALPAVGRIYQITLDGQVRTVIDATRIMACPNGVTAPAPGELLVAEFFYGNLLRWRDRQLTVLARGFRGADGLERGRDGTIYLSSWTQGKVWRLDARGKHPQLLLDGLKSAADFYLDEDAGRLLVPDMLAGTVLVLQLPSQS